MLHAGIQVVGRGRLAWYSLDSRHGGIAAAVFLYCGYVGSWLDALCQEGIGVPLLVCDTCGGRGSTQGKAGLALFG